MSRGKSKIVARGASRISNVTVVTEEGHESKIVVDNGSELKDVSIGPVNRASSLSEGDRPSGATAVLTSLIGALGLIGAALVYACL